MFTFSMAEPHSAPLAALPSTLFHAALVTAALWATSTGGELLADPADDPIEVSLAWPVQTTVHLCNCVVKVPTGIAPIIPDIPPVDIHTPGTAPVDPRTLFPGDPGTIGSDSTGAPLGSASTIYQESDVDDPPELLIGATPRYPRVMAEAGIDGRVTLTFVIDTLGHVVAGSVKAEASTHPAFVPAAEEATYASSFRPAHRHGVAVAVRVQQGVVFRH